MKKLLLFTLLGLTLILILLGYATIIWWGTLQSYIALFEVFVFSFLLYKTFIELKRI
jgi:hypothetical protein